MQKNFATKYQDNLNRLFCNKKKQFLRHHIKTQLIFFSWQQHFDKFYIILYRLEDLCSPFFRSPLFQTHSPALRAAARYASPPQVRWARASRYTVPGLPWHQCTAPQTHTHTHITNTAFSTEKIVENTINQCCGAGAAWSSQF